MTITALHVRTVIVGTCMYVIRTYSYVTTYVHISWCIWICIIIIIRMYYRKNVYKAKHNKIHLNLSIALLLGLIVFVSGIETAKSNRVSNTI